MTIKVRDHGFSFVELLIGLTILLAAMGTLMQVAASGQQLARSHAEASDLHQRVRVAAEKLQKDLSLAGAGSLRGPLAGGLTGYMAPIIPARLGARLPDASLSAFTDRVSLVYVADGAWPSPLSVTMAAAGDPVFIDAAAAGCPAAGLCGFSEGTRALLVDTGGVGAGHDLFTVTGNAGALAHGSPNPPFERTYAAGRSIVVPIVQRAYYFDRANRRLMAYDGYQSDMPLIDNVVDLHFAYFADGSASSVARPSEGTSNCVYDAGAPPVPRLEELGGEGLHQLTTEEMTDGPLCGAGAGVFDGDLLRIRMIRVTLRLQAASDDVRGGGPWFTRPGRSSSGYSYVPDYEVTFDVTPRNMNATVFPR